MSRGARDLLEELVIMVNDLLAALVIARSSEGGDCDEVLNHILVAEEIAEAILEALEELRERIDA